MSGATRVQLIPQGNPNRPGYRLRGLHNIVIHETANPAVGANAAMHANFVKNGGGPETVSFHYVVDDHESIQLLPDNEVGWHAGDGNGPGNYESVGIENCVNADGDFAKTITNLVALVKHLMAEYGIPVEHVRQHHYYSSYQKNCPTKLRANNEAGWKAFIARLQEPTPPPQPVTFDTYAHTHPYVGLPLDAGEVLRVLEDGKQYSTKLYERALLHKSPDGKSVLEARIGWMWLQATKGV